MAVPMTMLVNKDNALQLLSVVQNALRDRQQIGEVHGVFVGGWVARPT